MKTYSIIQNKLLEATREAIRFVGLVALIMAYKVNKYSLLMHCIKIKSPAKFLLNEQYVFVGGNISFFCVLSCSSEEA